MLRLKFEERCGSSEGLEVPVNGLVIFLSINSIDFFPESILVLLNFLQL